MANKVNLVVILDNSIPIEIRTAGYSFGDVDSRFIITAMKEACRQTLELAAENAKLLHTDSMIGGCPECGVEDVDKKSITDTINQVE